ncbi:MAG: sulfatase-like hydrolase/transferase [Halobacteriales archaeon]
MPVDRPNVVLIVADDQRFDTLGALGNDRIATPNLDRLVAEGCAFTRHHNAGADQGAVCVPARAMLHSGRSLFRLEGPGGITTDHPPLPGRFREAGYHAVGTGKWHNGIDAFDRCFDAGRDVYFGGMGNHWNVPVASREPGGEWPDPIPHRTFSGTGSLWTTDQVAERYTDGDHSSEVFADAAVDVIEGEESPFFAYMATMAPHDPRTAPGEYLSRYDPADLPLPESFRPEHPFDNGHLDLRDEGLATHPRDPEEIRRHIADYYAMITHLDAQVGRVLDALEATGERGDTLVAFTADHGLAVGRHGLMGKQNLYDHSLRVPLLLSGPGVPAGERRDVLSVHYDLYPTLCELAGLAAPVDLDGESLVPAIEDGTAPREALLCAYEDEMRAVREGDLKLIEYAVAGRRHTQLFDLAADPAETVDRSEDPASADDLARLRDRLGTLRREHGDPAGWDARA